jgi:hypothetical protein
MSQESSRFGKHCRDVFHSAMPYLLLAVIVVGTGDLTVGGGSSDGGQMGENAANVRVTDAGGFYGALVVILCALSSITSAAYRRFRLAYFFLVLATAAFLFRTANKLSWVFPWP